MFCKTCGNELHENAVICPKCGCAVGNAKPIKQKSSNNTSKALTVINYMSVILICIATMFIASSVFSATVDVYEGYSSIITTYYAYFWTNIEDSITGMVFAIIALVVSIIGFVLGLKKENKDKSFRSSVIFIISIVLLITSIVCYGNCGY